MFLLYAALTFSSVHVEPRSFPDTARVVTINSAKDWNEFAVETPPAVDFQTSSVVVVFGGERPTGGWKVNVTKVEKRGDECSVS